MRKCLLGVLLTLPLITACATPLSPKEAAFATVVPIRMNPDLQLQVVGIDYDSRFPTITVSVENHSRDEIWFKVAGYGSQLLVYSESTGEWRVIEDRATYTGDAVEVLVPKGQGLNWLTMFWVDPDITDIDKPVVLRIVVVGRIYRDGVFTDEEVGTYIDITLPPEDVGKDLVGKVRRQRQSGRCRT